MTRMLYLEDSDLREFEATVQRVDGDRVALDRTAFYPTGGGQPHDTGQLVGPGGAAWDVVDVRKEGGDVWHQVPGHALAVGDAVRGVLDWTRRHHLMRTHTALHVLSAVIFRDFGAQVTGGNMEPLRGRLDFELTSVPEGFAAQLQEKVDAEVQAGRAVRWRALPREEALQIPDLIRTKVNLLPESLREIRVVEIDGLDLQADGGTHVGNTRDIGRIRIAGVKSKGKGFRRVRVEIEPA